MSARKSSCPSFVLQHLQDHHKEIIVDVRNIKEIKSAQQQVFVIPVSICSDGDGDGDGDGDCQSIISEEWKDAIGESSKLIARVWNGSARWWNLHSPMLKLFQSDSNHNRSSRSDDPSLCSSDIPVIALAQAEVAAYRLVRDIFDSGNNIAFPKVLYFSHDDISTQNSEHKHKHTHKHKHKHHNNLNNGHPCWALLSYVGEGSRCFSEQYKFNQDLIQGMIQTRHEFGFDEPHPRHGRLPIHLSQSYAKQLIDDFLLPLHLHFFQLHNSTTAQTQIQHLSPRNHTNWTYQHMLHMYESAAQLFIFPCNDVRIDQILSKFQQCVTQLKYEYQKHNIQALPAVLCHLDLQPQNLMFYTDISTSTSTSTCTSSLPQIRCILDWEEAAYADPRFELLLIGRKVCANRDQASYIWKHYQQLLQKYSYTNHIDIGDLEPWLKLEGVHSILTYLLQMGIHRHRNNNGNGNGNDDGNSNTSGRGETWETPLDLLEKINREFHRLAHLGWRFCTDDKSVHGG